MTKRLVVGALIAALAGLAAGCAEECVDQFDCRNDKGVPDEGRRWTCVDEKCRQEDIPEEEPEPEEDGGTDGGSDGGMPGSLAENDACMNSTECGPDLRCDPAMTGTTCQPVHVAFTRNTSAVTTGDVAVAVRFDKNVASTGLSEGAQASRFPRWSKDGSRVAFVRDVNGAGDEDEIVVRNLPLTDGQATVLSAAAAPAGPSPINHLEWAPSDLLAWTTGTDKSGISVGNFSMTAPSALEVAVSGGFPSWSDDGSKLAYNTSAGLFTVSANGMNRAAVTGGESGVQPYYRGSWLLYTRQAEGTAAVDRSELAVVSVNGGTATVVAPADVAAAPTAETPVTYGSFVTDPTWAPDGSWVAFTRVYYAWSLAGEPVLCGSGDPVQTCPNGQAANVVFLQKVNATTGAADGQAVKLADNAGLASFSPSGLRVAYVSGRRLHVQKINPTTGAADGAAIAHTQGGIYTGASDDSRPRWQPK